MQRRDGDRLLAVFPTEAHAARAAEELRRTVPEAVVDIDARGDSDTALTAEMQQEMRDSWVSPQASFLFTKEAAKGMLATAVIGSAIGVVVLLPFAFIEIGGFALWVRLLFAAALGITVGGTAALIMAGLTARGPAEPLAAERGVVLSAQPVESSVAKVLARGGAIRIDHMHGGGATETLTTEEERREGGVFEELAEMVREPGGDWSHVDNGRNRDPRAH